jgi:MFS family permease
VTFTGLVRTNRNFRLLWFGQIVSQLGDWFNAIAVYALLLDLTGSATAVAAMMVMQLLPTAIVGPWAGVIVDRVNRQRVLVVADVVRGCLMLGLLFVRSSEDVWLAYIITGLSVTATGFFEPARTAILANITAKEELIPANALSVATWSVMLALGAAVGGLVTAALGRDAAFLLNSASFLASAIFIGRMRPPQTPLTRTDHAHRHEKRAGFGEGLRFLRSHPRILALVTIKGVWAIAGGILLLLTVFGERVFPVGQSSASGIGVLFTARGVGAALGSLSARRLSGHYPERLAAIIAPCYLLAGMGYVCFGLAPTLKLATAAIVVAHMNGSLLWIASTVLLQMSVPDRFRGRVFAIDFAFMTLVSSMMSYVTGLALDTLHLGPRALAVALGMAYLIPALVWTGLARRLAAGVGRDAASDS